VGLKKKPPFLPSYSFALTVSVCHFQQIFGAAPHWNVQNAVTKDVMMAFVSDCESMAHPAECVLIHKPVLEKAMLAGQTWLKIPHCQEKASPDCQS
jgi:hypothetical protein